MWQESRGVNVVYMVPVLNAAYAARLAAPPLPDISAPVHCTAAGCLSGGFQRRGVARVPSDDVSDPRGSGSVNFTIIGR